MTNAELRSRSTLNARISSSRPPRNSSRVCKVIKRHREFVKHIENMVCNVYVSMVLSIIEYCDVVYAGTSQVNLSKIDNLFYRGLRICTNANVSISRKVLCNNHAVAPMEETLICYYLCINKQTRIICSKRNK